MNGGSSLTMKFNKLTTLKIFKKMGGAAIIGLQVYRTVLSFKIFSIDSILKVLKAENNLVWPKSHLPVIKETTEIKNTKETKKMKKSNGFAIFVFFVAVCSALAAIACYLYKKEKELDDYEDMLFSEEYLEGYMPEGACDCEEHAIEHTLEEPTL